MWESNNSYKILCCVSKCLIEIKIHLVGFQRNKQIPWSPQVHSQVSLWSRLMFWGRVRRGRERGFPSPKSGWWLGVKWRGELIHDVESLWGGAMCWEDCTWHWRSHHVSPIVWAAAWVSSGTLLGYQHVFFFFLFHAETSSRLSCELHAILGKQFII